MGEPADTVFQKVPWLSSCQAAAIPPAIHPIPPPPPCRTRPPPRRLQQLQHVSDIPAMDSQAPAPPQPAPAGLTVQAGAAVQQHPTTASAGLGGTVSIVLMSLLMRLNVHLSEEEAIAWSSLLTAAIGWGLKVLSRKFPVLAAPISGAGQVQQVTTGGS